MISNDDFNRFVDIRFDSLGYIYSSPLHSASQITEIKIIEITFNEKLLLNYFVKQR